MWGGADLAGIDGVPETHILLPLHNIYPFTIDPPKGFIFQASWLANSITIVLLWVLFHFGERTQKRDS
jgi:hypothetical protein